MSVGIGGLVTLVGLGILAMTARRFRARRVLFLGGVVCLAIGVYGLVTGIRGELIRRRVAAFVADAGKGDLAAVRRKLDADPLLANAVQRSAFVRQGVEGADIGFGRVIANRPLTAAAKGLHRDVVELLVSRGADAGAVLEDGSTALHLTGDVDTSGNAKASADRAAILEILIAHGADVNARDDNGMTPLHRNACDPGAIAVLLQHHAEVNARDGSGDTPLHRAVIPLSDNSEAVRLLVEHGAEVDARNHTGMTPLIVASRNLPDLEALVAHHASVKVSDGAGRTPLHQIAESPNNLRSDLDVLALFCAAGLRPDSSDRAGATPYGIASTMLAKESSASWQQGRRRVVQFLSPGGPCERLAGSAGAATMDQRTFAVAEALCAEDSAKGCERAAYDYESGAGVAVDQARAVSLYEKACKLGLQSACTSLGFDYDQGHGTSADPSKAAALYGPACEAGESRACFNLAILYSTGRGVAADRAKSLALFRRACQGGEPDACEQAGPARPAP